MTSRAPLFLGFLAGFCLACGSEPESAAEPPDVAAVPVEVGGTYRVTGLTVELESGMEREIAGLLVLSRRGGEYRSSFELGTKLPGPDGPLETQVIGTGEGTMDGDGVLRGTARTQLVIASMSGMPARFPFIPRFVGPRVVSTTVTSFGDDDTIEIQIETRAEAGEIYRSTRTTLKGSLLPGSETLGEPPAR